MVQGWDDEVMFNLQVNRTLTAIIAETTNRSMGGKGVIDYIMKVLPLESDKEINIEFTAEQLNERRRELLARREEMIKRKKAEEQKKLDGRGTENNN